jgi:ComF family protein
VRLVAEQGMCVRCRNTVYAFESNLALFPYAGAAMTLLQSLKFGARRRLAPWFADYAWRALKRTDRLHTLVPVPSRRRTGSDGIVALVTRCLRRAHGMTVKNLLERRGGAPQKSLNYPERQENLKKRIHLAPDESARSIPAHVVLVDDVFTTGATLDACARVLREAGCGVVFGITLAIEE